MLDKLKAWLGEAAETQTDQDVNLHLAAAILLFEIAKSDHSIEPTERERLQQALISRWSLPDDELQDLLAVAEREAELSASLHQQVDVINQHFSPEQKFQLLCDLWHVAYADDELHHYEEHLIRRIADLLYVSHSDFMRAKHLCLQTTN